jgi:hypothetical protein
VNNPGQVAPQFMPLSPSALICYDPESSLSLRKTSRERWLQGIPLEHNGRRNASFGRGRNCFLAAIATPVLFISLPG